ncbi:hypothetical protein [Methylocystis rosea]|uniref:Uncharacterized protein n=1 Tax=Methylocystis rosea TaxID=173366 RepID=A0A3G8M8R3_9HYPH|nr:hypothetical protein [Methylocystis rosea]AZG77188.1 hypothetical protein EHO51_10820 [Methylocystis rosea]
MKNTPDDAYVKAESGGTRTVEHLRAALKQRRVKLTDVARDLNIPYRSLQNYFNKNDMPLSLYEQICRFARIPRSYPMDGCRMKLDVENIKTALVDVLGQKLPSVSVNTSRESGMNIEIGNPPAEDRDFKSLRAAASMIVLLLDSKYDRICEAELNGPLDDA